jgi:hypothetical protein
MIVKFALLILLIGYTGWSYAGLFEQHKQRRMLKGFITALAATTMELVALHIVISNRLTGHL